MKPARLNQHYHLFISVKIVVVYAIVSGLWVFFSDFILERLVADPHIMSQIATMKGWIFVFITSVLLFYLIRRYVAHLSDINEKLFESERRFRELMERIHMIAIMLDSKGNIIFCNDYLLQLTGWMRDELIGKSWLDTFIPADIREQMKAILQQGIISGKIPFHHENRILTRNACELLVVWDNTMLFDAEGAIIGVASLGSDITLHRSMEAQLRQSQKMESIGTLAGGVAHDFNNILTVILSSCEMLRSKADDPKRVRLLLDQIDNAAQRAAKLTRSLLAFSRKQLTKPQPMDLNDLVIQIQDFLEKIIGGNVELFLRLSKEKLFILADQSQIEQVLMNLASNARDAMPNGGRLSLYTDVVKIDRQVIADDGTSISGQFAVLTMADSGIGITPDTQERIFEPFFTTKEVGKGTGLGLSMAYGIIRQHNGWITIDSEIGKGSSFKIYLPLIPTVENH